MKKPVFFLVNSSSLPDDNKYKFFITKMRILIKKEVKNQIKKLCLIL